MNRVFIRKVPTMITDKATRRRNSDRAAITKFCTIPYAVVRGCPKLYAKVANAGTQEVAGALPRGKERLRKQFDKVAAAPALERATKADVAAQAAAPEQG
jgi:hypothetical protein